MTVFQHNYLTWWNPYRFCWPKIRMGSSHAPWSFFPYRFCWPKILLCSSHAPWSFLPYRFCWPKILMCSSHAPWSFFPCCSLTLNGREWTKFGWLSGAAHTHKLSRARPQCSQAVQWLLRKAEWQGWCTWLLLLLHSSAVYFCPPTCLVLDWAEWTWWAQWICKSAYTSASEESKTPADRVTVLWLSRLFPVHVIIHHQTHIFKSKALRETS
jgi:hypothetical protein